MGSPRIQPVESSALPILTTLCCLPPASPDLPRVHPLVFMTPSAQLGLPV